METTFPMVPERSLCSEGRKAITLKIEHWRLKIEDWTLKIWMGTTFPMIPKLSLAQKAWKPYHRWSGWGPHFQWSPNWALPRRHESHIIEHLNGDHIPNGPRTELVLRRHESHIMDDPDGDHISNGPRTEEIKPLTSSKAISGYAYSGLIYLSPPWER